MVRHNNVTNKYQITNIIEHIVLKLVSPLQNVEAK
jgi:hypothetical protein